MEKGKKYRMIKLMRLIKYQINLMRTGIKQAKKCFNKYLKQLVKSIKIFKIINQDQLKYKMKTIVKNNNKY